MTTETMTLTTLDLWQPTQWVRITTVTGVTVRGQIESADERGVLLRYGSFEDGYNLGDPSEATGYFVAWSNIALAELEPLGSAVYGEKDETDFIDDGTVRVWQQEQRHSRLGLSGFPTGWGACPKVEVRLEDDLVQGILDSANETGITLYTGCLDLKQGVNAMKRHQYQFIPWAAVKRVRWDYTCNAQLSRV